MGLYTPKWKSKDLKIREEWIDNANPDDTKNQKILKRLAKNDEYDFVRVRAVAKINDQTFLTELVINDKEKWVRNVAVKNLKDQNTIAVVAKSDEAKEVRMAAIGILVNHKALAEIAKTDSNGSVRVAALKKLDDQNVLTEIATTDSSGSVRAAALKKLGTDKDQRDICQVIMTNDNLHVRNHYITKLDAEHVEGIVDLLIRDFDYNNAMLLNKIYHNYQLSPRYQQKIIQLKGKKLPQHDDQRTQHNDHIDGYWCQTDPPHRDSSLHTDNPFILFDL